MPCLVKFSMTLQTEILSTETSDFLKQIIFLKSFNSVFECHFHPKGSLKFSSVCLSKYFRPRSHCYNHDDEQCAHSVNYLQLSRKILISKSCLKKKTVKLTRNNKY